MNKLFTVDIGNSTIAIGIFEEKKLVSSFRFATNKEYLSTEYQLMVEASIKQKEILYNDIQGAVLSSTVPSLSIIFEQVIKNIFGFDPLIVGPGIKTRLNIKYENPKEIGPDRILHAVAGLNIAEPPLIIVDLGTGLVFDAINKKGEYLGGAIAAGVSISANALPVLLSTLPFVYWVFNKANGAVNKKLVLFTRYTLTYVSSPFSSLPYDLSM